MSTTDEEARTTTTVDSDETGERGNLQLAKIRHELRTPINHIIGYSEILLEETVEQAPTEVTIDLERIRSGGQQLLALVNEHLSEETFFGEGLNPAALARDLRTPVSQIIGCSQLLAGRRSGPGAAAFRADLEKITRAAKRLTTVTEARVFSRARPADTRPGLSARPARRSPTADTTRLLRETSVAESRRASQGRLLVVDDDAANREIVRRRLERMGHEVEMCGDGREAIERLRNRSFDLVLLDMVMPGLDGYGVLEELKADENLRHVPVVMVSALDHLDSAVRCIELGAEDYLPKPFDPILLRARVEAALEKKRLRDKEQVYLRRIEQERAKSDQLLLSILPRPIADRLKQGEGVIADSFPAVTVLFADLVGFTMLSLATPPSQVVRLLDAVFSEFDGLADRHGLEKIKTIGDAYMAAAGLPIPRNDHAEAAVRMALEMLQRMEVFNSIHETSLEMRVGISSGPVIAGVIGRNKFIYDLWGDTVNTASRMESHGEPGMIQITEETANLLPDELEVQARGPVDIKGKGPMTTFIVRESLASLE